MSSDWPVASTLLAGRYRLVALLETGGMAQVWQAQDELLDRPVAVKLPTGSQVVWREARLAARLSHPGIAAVHDYREAVRPDGAVVPFVVMELLAGDTVAARVDRRPFGWAEAAQIGAAVADALAAAHASGVVHRDIKPGNVMLTANGVKILDFGISVAAGEQDDDDTGATFGTPAYVAPERLDGMPAAPATDVYGLGVLLFEMVTGDPPYPVDTWDELAAARTAGPAELPTSLPADFREAVASCLREDPDERPTAARVRSTLLAVALRSRPADAGQATATNPASVRVGSPRVSFDLTPTARTPSSLDGNPAERRIAKLRAASQHVDQNPTARNAATAGLTGFPQIQPAADGATTGAADNPADLRRALVGGRVDAGGTPTRTGKARNDTPRAGTVPTTGRREHRVSFALLDAAGQEAPVGPSQVRDHPPGPATRGAADETRPGQEPFPPRAARTPATQPSAQGPSPALTDLGAEPTATPAVAAPPRRRRTIIGAAVVATTMLGALFSVLWRHPDPDVQATATPSARSSATSSVLLAPAQPNPAHTHHGAPTGPPPARSLADAVDRMRTAIESGIAGRQIRRDVGTDLLNVLRPLTNTRATDLRDRFDTLRRKIRTRINEGSVSAERGNLLQARLADIDRALGT